MSCVVYREGKGHFEHGIECEVARVDVEHLEAHLNSGWSVNPPGYVTEAADDDDGLDEIRAAAKAAGIEGWDTKRIKTLKAALAELG